MKDLVIPVYATVLIYRSHSLNAFIDEFSKLMNGPSDLDLSRFPFRFSYSVLKQHPKKKCSRSTSLTVTSVTDAHIKQPSIHSIQVRCKGKNIQDNHNRLLLLSPVTVQVRRRHSRENHQVFFQIWSVSLPYLGLTVYLCAASATYFSHRNVQDCARDEKTCFS